MPLRLCRCDRGDLQVGAQNKKLEDITLSDLDAPAETMARFSDVVELVEGRFTVTLKDRTGIAAGTVRKEG